MMVEEKCPEKPATPKKMNLDIDKEPEATFVLGDDDAHLEGKKMKKKDGKKDKAKRKTCSWNFWVSANCVFLCMLL